MILSQDRDCSLGVAYNALPASMLPQKPACCLLSSLVFAPYLRPGVQNRSTMRSLIQLYPDDASFPPLLNQRFGPGLARQMLTDAIIQVISHPSLLALAFHPERYLPQSLVQQSLPDRSDSRILVMTDSFHCLPGIEHSVPYFPPKGPTKGHSDFDRMNLQFLITISIFGILAQRYNKLNGLLSLYLEHMPDMK